MKKQNILVFQLALSLLLVSINALSNTAISIPGEEMSDKAFLQPDTSGITWHDPDKEPFSLSGFEWIGQDGVYRRLPVHPDWEIPEDVDFLANYTAGGQVRFVTDSKTIRIKVKYKVRTGKDYVPPSGKNGFDLYMKRKGISTFVKATRFSGDSADFYSELFVSQKSQLREFTLNFPLYHEVESLQIGLDEEALVNAPDAFTFPGKIVIYGTSITEGGSVSRPGMLYSNMLSRRLDAEFINLGFSGNGKGEPELAQLINQISGAGLIILDYEANASETIKETLASFIQIIRDKQADVPILLMSKIRFVREPDGSDGYERLLANRDFQKKLIEERRTAGDQNIYFLDGPEVLGDDYHECTLDGVHPTDLGAYRIFEALHEAILDIFPDRKTGSKFIADHTVARENVLRSIPREYIDLARTNLHVAYQHTSHGTHVSRGIFGLQDYKKGDEILFAVSNKQPESGKLDFWDNPIVKYAPEGMDGSDLSRNEIAFIQATRNFLDDPANKAINVVMWSWCNIARHKPAENYIPGMDSLIAEYGTGGSKIGSGEGQRENSVTFIFMTGHANEDENLGEKHPKAQAELIVENCREKSQFCLDYYSIDTHDMKGRYWEDAGDDGNSKMYGGNFYTDWQSQNQPGEGWYENRQTPGGKVVFGAHNTQHITANRKAYAMWWILARIAGWDGN